MLKVGVYMNNLSLEEYVENSISVRNILMNVLA
ncbi:hypothetical protein CAXC1_310028 [Candidatus Xenohaliotis californiensis]|uniref:Uncharacterized protein n=1 Tax=Candidatus Xenohaliotis californiensis TaxID=84677 RepID=A0ABP0ET33_9RICK|nr:hypothetical protein CAXC1_310028 [Candidatus Xenohaliotis californiensis]